MSQPNGSTRFGRQSSSAVRESMTRKTELWTTGGATVAEKNRFTCGYVELSRRSKLHETQTNETEFNTRNKMSIPYRSVGDRKIQSFLVTVPRFFANILLRVESLHGYPPKVSGFRAAERNS